LFLIIAFSIVSSLRMQAVMANFLAFQDAYEKGLSRDKTSPDQEWQKNPFSTNSLLH